ncbi:MAG: hypothetical protein Q4D86_09880 [Pasteurella oralis]|uniref:hypothetical protein n=1 Tax=Pasteurella oralis TaxID=1071947 RepID=UPI0026F707D5|nr:hypothetical protein [Pasteurella oralis]
MIQQRVLPKKAYSLHDAVKYISQNYQIDISIRDLLEYIQNGNLISSVYLSGDKENIHLISRKEVDFIKDSDEFRELRLDYSDVSLYFRFNPQEFEIGWSKDYLWLHKENSFFDFYICLSREKYTYERLRKIVQISIFNGNISEVENVSFEGYFRINKVGLNEFNIDEVINTGSFKKFPNYVTAIYGETVCFLTIDENKTPLYLDDIRILHNHLIDFLKAFSVIDEGDDRIIENGKLKDELERVKEENNKKDKEIEKLKQQLDQKNAPILLNEFMENDRLALAIQARKDYWGNYKPEIGNTPKADSTAKEIQGKYSLSQKQAQAIEIVACPINRN